MHNNCNTKHKHLTIDLRKLIEKWKKEGKSNREIARLLGKNHQTINNEIKRGLVIQRTSYGKFKKVYKAEFAQVIYDKNKRNCGRKLKVDYVIRDKVIHYLKYKHSPEMISKTKLDGKISTSTIYYWINKGFFGLKRSVLNYARKRKKKENSEKRRVRILGKSIEERPKEINNREEVGHYEIDTVILRKEKGQCLLTLTDRKSRYEIIRLIEDKTVKSVNKALKEVLKEYEIKSITADNGLEFARLYEVFDYEKIYYAHPYSSYERGSNENHNRLIRRFLPKGTKNTTQERVAFIEDWINNYPKKLFNYKTPFEVFSIG